MKKDISLIHKIISSNRGEYIFHEFFIDKYAELNEIFYKHNFQYNFLNRKYKQYNDNLNKILQIENI